MIDASLTPHAAAVAMHAAPVTVQYDAATDAHIKNYLAAGDRVAGFMDLTMKVCAVLLVLLAAAWVIGILPAAYRLF